MSSPSTAAIVERPLLERLASVPGFEPATALDHVGGQLPSLERILRRFVQIYSDGAPALLAAPTGDGIALWRSSCHSLRGACSTVGATRLDTPLQASSASWRPRRTRRRCSRRPAG